MILLLIDSSLCIAKTRKMQLMRMRQQLISPKRFPWTTKDGFTTL